MTRRIRGLLWFFLFCGFFSLAFTPAYEIADALLLAFLLTFLIVATGMKLWNMWKYRSDPQRMFELHISSGQGGLWERRWRHWFLDEHDEDKSS